jgi:putative membrane protein
MVVASDPRVFFAAERTLLAWVRTGITVMALGFVVARFGLFLEILAASSRAAHGPLPASETLSAALGVSLVLAGVLSILGALLNHLRYVRTLPAQDVPALTLPWFAPTAAALLALMGGLLALYLALS